MDDLTSGIDAKLDELNERAKGLKEQLSNGDLDSEGQKALSEKLETLDAEVQPLLRERAEAVNAAGIKAMGERLETMERTIAERGRESDYPFAAPADGAADSQVYGPNGERSFFNDIRLANARDAKAVERLMEGNELEGKAMGEGVPADGGFLVPTDIRSELIARREGSSIARSLFSSTSTSVDEVEFLRSTNGLAVAWTAEFAQKIKSQMTFSSFSARTFTAAGLVVTSNQLLADNKYSVDRMIANDFAKRFGWLEEISFWEGDGEGEPLGLLNTPGVGSTAVKAGEDSNATIWNIVDAIADAITSIYTNFYGAPTAIVMHPRTWGAIVKARESTAPSTYLIGAGSTAFGRRPNDPLPGYGSAAFPRGELHGVPVYTTPSVPHTLGDKSNETCVFVGDFGQGLILDREGITTDRSEHVYFETNQTVFRSEERLGFTAGRYPEAFQVVAGDAFAGI